MINICILCGILNYSVTGQIQGHCWWSFLKVKPSVLLVPDSSWEVIVGSNPSPQTSRCIFSRAWKDTSRCDDRWLPGNSGVFQQRNWRYFKCTQIHQRSEFNELTLVGIDRVSTIFVLHRIHLFWGLHNKIGFNMFKPYHTVVNGLWMDTFWR